MQTADVMTKTQELECWFVQVVPGVVKSVLSSGKKAIGAGAGNPPVIVDDTADIKKLQKTLLMDVHSTTTCHVSLKKKYLLFPTLQMN